MIMHRRGEKTYKIAEEKEIDHQRITWKLERGSRRAWKEERCPQKGHVKG